MFPYIPNHYQHDCRLTRLVLGNGGTNLVLKGISGWKRKYLKDLFTTLVEGPWRWNLLIFIVSFVFTWFVFAGYYYCLCYVHGDFIPEANDLASCIVNARSFTSMLLFSIETQTTIGYGFRSVTEDCPLVYLGVMMQSVVGIGLQAVLAGIVVTKVKRGKRRSNTVFFSHTACVFQEDGELYLATRVGDISKSNVLEPKARGVLIKKEFSELGHLPVRHYGFEMKGEGGQPWLFTAWPTLIVHKIDQDSPFWKMSRDDFLQLNFEFMVVLEGIVSCTGSSFRACTSYLPWEITWGHRFYPMSFVRDKNYGIKVKFANFHKTRPVKTPLCSARDLCEMRLSGRWSAHRPTVRCRSHFKESRYSVTDTFLGSLTNIRSRNWL